MKASVVIPHYGDPEPTLALIEQVRPQLDGRHELIVADDNSPTPFPATPEVRVVRRSSNGGFGSAVNSGAAVASGDLLLILNSDLDVPATFIADLLAAAEPWLPCVAGPRLVENGAIGHSTRHFPRVRHQVVEWLTPLARWRDRRALHEAVGHDTAAVSSTTPVVTDWLVGAALLLPLAAFRDVGGFDEAFYMNSEEVDLQRRLRLRGLPAVYVPTVTVGHVGGGSSDPSKRRRWVVAARWHYAEKWGGTAALRLGLTSASTINLVWNSARAIGGRDTAPWRTLCEELALIWRDSPR